MDIIDIRVWASDTVKTITITQDVGVTHYDMMVREFIPQEGDALKRKWKTDGKEQYYECTPYAIADMRQAGNTVREFAKTTICEAIRHYIGDRDQLLQDTYWMAQNYSTTANVSNKNKPQEPLRLMKHRAKKSVNYCKPPYCCGMLLVWNHALIVYAVKKH
jgi:hypothetical protein